MVIDSTSPPLCTIKILSVDVGVAAPTPPKKVFPDTPNIPPNLAFVLPDIIPFMFVSPLMPMSPLTVVTSAA